MDRGTLIEQVRVGMVAFSSDGKRIGKVTLLCLALAACGQPTLSTEQATISAEQVRGIAEGKMPMVRESVRHTGQGYPKAGFNNEQEVEMARVGVPVERFLLGLEGLKALQSGHALATLVTPNHFWQVPITVNGEGRTAVHVRWTGSAWEWGGCCEQPSNSRNLTVVQQQFVHLSAPVKSILVTSPTHYEHAVEVAWITENDQDLLILLHAPTYFPVLREKVMKPYPALELLTELTAVLSSE